MVRNHDMAVAKTFCFVLLNEEIALLKLVTLKSEESRPNSVAVILASNSSGSGRHLEDEQVVWTCFKKSTLVAYLVFATCRQVSLRKAILSSGLSTINCTTYLGRWNGLQEHFNFLGSLTFFLGGPQWVCRLLPLDCLLPERLQFGKYSVGKFRAYLASLVTFFNIENIN